MSAMSKHFLSDMFVRCTGYTYTNMARLFIRLFVGVMFMQFGIRQLMQFHELAAQYPTVLGMSPEAGLTVMIVVEIVCSLLIMVGFLTRIAVIPPILTMIGAIYFALNGDVPTAGVYDLSAGSQPYIPMMFIGIYVFILLAGPGKISLDYFISIFLISRNGKNERDELEEV